MAQICPYVLANLSATLCNDDNEEWGPILARALKNTIDEKTPDEDDEHSYTIFSMQLLIMCKEDSCGKYNSCQGFIRNAG